MHKNFVLLGLVCSLASGTTHAAMGCGAGRIPIEINASIQITPEDNGCSLLAKKLVVNRFFPTAVFLYEEWGMGGTCFVGELTGHATVAGRTIAIEGKSFSAQYASDAFSLFEQAEAIRTVWDAQSDGEPWYFGEANTWVELTQRGRAKPFLQIAFDDTFLFNTEGLDTEKLVAVSPGVQGNLLIEGPIFFPSAPMQGRLCVAEDLLN